MKKALKITVIFLAMAFVLIQFDRPARTNPATIQSETLFANVDVPPNVQSILIRSCADCHSHDTNWVWYSNVAPISWGMTDHVKVGREELNFSKWSTYPTDRKLHKLEEICEEVENGEMPHYQYLWLHWDAKLSVEDIKSLCEWSRIENQKLRESENSN